MKVNILRKNGLEIVDLNRRKAIRERCLNCTGWNYKEVTECNFSNDCPLHPFRSGEGKQNSKDRTQAIRDYCLWCMNGQRSEIAKCSSPDCPLYPYRKYRTDTSVKIKP